MHTRSRRHYTRVLSEAGYHEAMLGLSLSKKASLERMPTVAAKLAPLDKGHNKVLESVAMWLDVVMPRYWWQEFDTYRIGVTRQSESTMHTMMKEQITQENFVRDVSFYTLERLNVLRDAGHFLQLKAELPEGFLQRRVVHMNYKALRHIILQRHDHRLPEWQDFIVDVIDDLQHPELLGGVPKLEGK